MTIFNPYAEGRGDQTCWSDPEILSHLDETNGFDIARVTMELVLFQLYEEALGETRPDRLSVVRPQERVQRRTVSCALPQWCRSSMLLCR